jgi:hypothetical protein
MIGKVLTRKLSQNKDYGASILFPLALLAINIWRYKQPAYIGGDEDAYLAKAAWLAGRNVDLATSWFSGYSILLTPAEFIARDPHAVWLGVLTINAALLATTFIILSHIIRGVVPGSDSKRFQVLLLVMLYPSWAVFSGYSFPNMGFLLFHALACWSILHLQTSKNKYLLIHIFSVVALCSIHGTGFLILGASIITLLISSIGSLKTFFVRISAVVVMLGGALATRTIQKTINSGMISPGFHQGEGHYEGFFHNIFLNFNQVGQLTTSILHQLLGILAVTAIATLGLLPFGNVFMPVEILRGLFKSGASTQNKLSTGLFEFFAFAGFLLVIFLPTIMFQNPCRGCIKFEDSIHLRFIEMALLPVLTIAIYKYMDLGLKRRLYGLLTNLVLIGFAIAKIAHETNSRWPMPALKAQFTSIVGFWPLAITGNSPMRNVLRSGLSNFDQFPNMYLALTMGMIGVSLYCIMQFRFRFFLMLIIFIGTMFIQDMYHQLVVDRWAKAPEIVHVVRQLQEADVPVSVHRHEHGNSDYSTEYHQLTYFLTDLGIQRVFPGSSMSERCPKLLISDSPEDWKSLCSYKSVFYDENYEFYALVNTEGG